MEYFFEKKKKNQITHENIKISICLTKKFFRVTYIYIFFFLTSIKLETIWIYHQQVNRQVFYWPKNRNPLLKLNIKLAMTKFYRLKLESKVKNSQWRPWDNVLSIAMAEAEASPFFFETQAREGTILQIKLHTDTSSTLVGIFAQLSANAHARVYLLTDARILFIFTIHETNRTRPRSQIRILGKNIFIL